MTDNDTEKEDFSHYGRLAEILQKADFSADSRVSHSLKNRLLGKIPPAPMCRSARCWALPAAAFALGALALAVLLPLRKPAADNAYLTYNTPADIYGDCGRQGLKDYLLKPAF